MRGFFRRGDRLGHDLRAARPQAPERLVAEIEGRVRSSGRVRPRGSLRVAIPVGFTAVLVAALALVGGISYAASSVQHAAQTVSHVFVARASHQASASNAPIIIRGLSSGGDQYKPGYGWGDPNHIHYGPPGLGCPGPTFCTTKIKGQNKRVLLAKMLKKYAIIKTSFSIDEQAIIWINVAAGKGIHAKRIQIVQKLSNVGKGVKGVPVKNLRYIVLIPRTIPLTLAVPKHLLKAGKTYYIRITAKSYFGNIKRLYIPFEV